MVQKSFVGTAVVRLMVDCPKCQHANGFDAWEIEILESEDCDFEALLYFIDAENIELKHEFLHNLADICFRIRENASRELHAENEQLKKVVQDTKDWASSEVMGYKDLSDEVVRLREHVKHVEEQNVELKVENDRLRAELDKTKKELDAWRMG